MILSVRVGELALLSFVLRQRVTGRPSKPGGNSRVYCSKRTIFADMVHRGTRWYGGRYSGGSVFANMPVPL